MSNDIRSAVVEVFGQIVPEARGEELEADESFRDQFEIDSLDFLNFVLALEARFELQVPETEYPRLGSLSGAVNYLRERIEAVKSGETV